MSPRARHRRRRASRRQILLGLCCLSVVAVAAGALARRGGDGGRLDAIDRRAPAVASTTAPPAPTDTTVVLVPVTTGVPVPTMATTTSAAPAVAVTPVPASTAPAAPAPPPALTGEGAVLTPPAPPLPPRPIDKARGCHSAVDAGWKVVDCGALRTNGIVLLWVVESRGKGLRAIVLREQETSQWAVVLAAADDDGSRFSSIGVRGEDLSGDGHPELTFGFHLRTADRALALDVVEPSATVGLHRNLPAGSAVLTKGELVTWAATGDGRAERAAIRHVDGGWRVVAAEPVERGTAPPSMV